MSLPVSELAEVMKRREPHFSAKSLLDIGIGGKNVAGLPPKRKVFGNRNRSLQPKNTSKKYYHPFGRATEIQKFALRLEQFKVMQAKYNQY